MKNKNSPGRTGSKAKNLLASLPTAKVEPKDKKSKIIDKDFFLTMNVEFGPRFSKKEMSRKEFIALLKSESRNYPTSFIGGMLKHFSEHYDKLAIKKSPSEKAAYLSKGPIRTFGSVYYGCGSCNYAPGRGSLCIWWDEDEDGGSDCDPC